MAKRHRKFETIKVSALSAHEAARELAQEVCEELREWHDNLPESLQSSSRADALDEAVSALEDVCSTLEGLEAPDSLVDAEIEVAHLLPRRKNRPLSRADRLLNACATLNDAADWIEARSAEMYEREDEDEHDASLEVEDFAQALRDAASDLEAVEIPGMY